MPTKKPGGLGQSHEGLGVANALRDCFACGVVLVDDKGKIGLLTNEAAQILGINTAQTPNLSLEILPAPLQQIVREAQSSGKPVAERSVEVGAAGRKQTWVRASAAPAEGGKKQVALVLRGLVSTGQIADSLRQLERLASLGTLSAAMAHEIRNALVAGKTFVDLLLEKNQDAELAGVVRRELGRIDGIVSRMLKFAGSARTEFGPVHLHTTLEHSLRLVQPQLESKAIALEQSFQASPDRVHGDDYELEQAFVNLFLNALEAMRPDGKLTVTTDVVRGGAASAGSGGSCDGAQLCVTIKDTGVGIAPEDLGRLFEPFFTTKAGGTGLGLAITQRILREHGGRIDARSDSGRGTTFTILLPAGPPAAGNPKSEIRTPKQT